MDKREYLRSQGFEVGERGRFSAEMLEALKSFEGEETQDRNIVSRSTIVRSISVPQRDANVYMCVLEDGGRVAMGFCNRCKDSIRYCECSGGPMPPDYFDSNVDKWYPIESKMEVS